MAINYLTMQKFLGIQSPGYNIQFLNVFLRAYLYIKSKDIRNNDSLQAQGVIIKKLSQAIQKNYSQKLENKGASKKL